VNYYELLNISRDANDSEIKRAYFSAVKLHSPDSDPEGFKARRIAYETLSSPKKRAEYDAYFAAPDNIQNELLAARELIRENKYKKAADFLTELDTKNPDSAEIKRLLAEVLWLMNKSVSAEKICRELVEKDPSDCDTHLLRARISESLDHLKKAGDCFKAAVKADPLNRKAWTEYMHYTMKHESERIKDVFEHAMEVSEDLFLDDYYIYLAGAIELNFSQDGNLFATEKPLKYCDKFAELFISDKNHEKAIYENLMRTIPVLSEIEELIPFVEKILPALESGKHRSEDDEEEFRRIHTNITVNKLRSDKRIHDALVEATEFLLDGTGDKEEKLTMECYIVFHLAAMRPSIKVLRDEYPDCFKLNQAFYTDVLNERKIESLTEKYLAIYKRLKPIENDADDEEFDGDFDEPENVKPFVRETPKTGRNDPCPCGSGKKYKKCCGKG